MEDKITRTVAIDVERYNHLLELEARVNVVCILANNDRYIGREELLLILGRGHLPLAVEFED